MDKQKQNKLEEKGWKIGSTQDFLGLTDEEAAYIDLKIALSQDLRGYREEKKLTQNQVARLLKSSQSRVAKMEAGDPSVSIDLLIRALLTLGAQKKHLAAMMR